MITRSRFLHSTNGMRGRELQHLNHALTIDGSRKGRHPSHKWNLRIELYRSRQEAVAGKVCDCAVLHGLGWWMHLWPRLKAERKCPGTLTILRILITVMYFGKCESEVYSYKNHGTACREPAPPLQDEGFFS